MRLCRSKTGRAGRERGGVTAVEVAIVAPVTFLLLIGLLVAGAGMFRYQQLSALAHEGARWASLHGRQAQGSQSDLPTANDVMKNVIRPMSVSLDQQRLTCRVNRDAANRTVVVTLTYDWIPEGYLDAMTMNASAQMPILY